MVDLYAAVESGGETVGVFSTLDKAKASVEAKIADDIRGGYYGFHNDDPLPELTWQTQEGHDRACGFVRGGGYFNKLARWRRCDPVVYGIVLDPMALR